MKYADFMARIRQLDNVSARWMLRHFYIIFFELVLIIIFFIFLLNTFKVIDISNRIPADNTLEQLLAQQATNTLIIIVLLLINSFWLLYMFSGMERMRALLKEISYNLLRRKGP